MSLRKDSSLSILVLRMTRVNSPCVLYRLPLTTSILVPNNVIAFLSSLQLQHLHNHQNRNQQRRLTTFHPYHDVDTVIPIWANFWNALVAMSSITAHKSTRTLVSNPKKPSVDRFRRRSLQWSQRWNDLMSSQKTRCFRRNLSKTVSGIFAGYASSACMCWGSVRDPYSWFCQVPGGSLRDLLPLCRSDNMGWFCYLTRSRN
jgi:hypothetical protein